MSGRLYLDHNADAAVLPAALAAYLETARDFGNPSSRHQSGQRALAHLDHARALVARALGADPHEIVFTSGGTEADALALLGVIGDDDGSQVVTSNIEHPAVARTLAGLAEAGRIRLTVVRSEPSGQVNLAKLVAQLTHATRLVSLVLACNETGVMQPVRELAAAARRLGVQVHTDAVQAVGRMRVNVRELGVDLLSLSGHKVGAVPGIGALYVRQGVELSPVVVGGGQEGGRRASTENVAGAASLAAALALLPDEAQLTAWAARRDQLEQKMLQRVQGVSILGGASPRLCNTSCLRFVGCPGDAIMMALDLDGIAISTGSACSSGSVDPSPILLGMGLTPKEALETVRFSLSPSIGEADVERIVERTENVVARIRAAR